AWVLRYPDQDAVIIVLRNGYGSTERLEQNLQAVLFGQPPHLPARSPKDVLAHCAQQIWRFATERLLVSGLAALLAVLTIVTAVRMRGRSDSASKTAGLLRV